MNVQCIFEFLILHDLILSVILVPMDIECTVNRNINWMYVWSIFRIEYFCCIQKYFSNAKTQMNYFLSKKSIYYWDFVNFFNPFFLTSSKLICDLSHYSCFVGKDKLEREKTFHWSCFLQCHIFLFLSGNLSYFVYEYFNLFYNWNTFAVDYQEYWNCHLVSTLYFCTFSLESKIMRIYANHIHNSQKMLILKNSISFGNKNMCFRNR